jgi:hypothetical protein
MSGCSFLAVPSNPRSSSLHRSGSVDGLDDCPASHPGKLVRNIGDFAGAGDLMRANPIAR